MQKHSQTLDTFSSSMESCFELLGFLFERNVRDQFLPCHLNTLFLGTPSFISLKGVEAMRVWLQDLFPSLRRSNLLDQVWFLRSVHGVWFHFSLSFLFE
jgi:hypothetical protein